MNWPTGVCCAGSGAHTSQRAEVADISVPATLQATIAARIDRLDPKAKRTLSAAAVVGSRFEPRPTDRLGVEPSLMTWSRPSSSIRSA